MQHGHGLKNQGSREEAAEAATHADLSKSRTGKRLEALTLVRDGQTGAMLYL